jgi:uncharacterized protein YacL (UPF0231 family)
MNLKGNYIMTKSQRLQLIKKVAKKVARERKVAAKLSREYSVYMDEKEVYNTIQSSGVMDTYSAMKEYDQWQ